MMFIGLHILSLFGLGLLYYNAADRLCELTILFHEYHI